MIAGFVKGQMLRLSVPLIAADTINYLTAKFLFQSSDWDGLEKWAHFAKGDEAYDIPLTDDRITEDAHLNLSAGKWMVYLHGNRFTDGTVVQRITTETKEIDVMATGTLDGEPFPEIPASVTEQILARLENVEQNGSGAVKSVNGNLPDKNGNVVIGLPEGSGSDEVFVAEYGVTGFSELLEAYNAGKALVMVDPNYGYWANLVLYDYDIFQFTNARGVVVQMYSLHDDDSWTKTETRLAREDAVADLSNYYTKSQTYTRAEVNGLVSAKVDKQQGKANAGKLLFVAEDGTVTTLALGAGLKIENGVLMITNAVVTAAVCGEFLCGEAVCGGAK